MKDLIERYRGEPDLLALLKAVRGRYGGLGPEVIADLAREMDVKENEIYAVTSFYAFLGGERVGRHVIRFCRCLPCSLKDSDAILGTVERELGIRAGQTTADGRFSLQMVNCIGACDIAPALMIDETRHGHLDPSKVVEVLATYR